jgi:tetratricopeptide (TPR) repeat protein
MRFNKYVSSLLLIAGITCGASIMKAQQINPITQATLNAYEEILASNPNDYSTLYQRAAQYFRLARYDDAITDLKKAIANTPDKESVMKADEYSLLASIYSEQKDNVKALEAVNQALLLRPNDYALLYMKGNAALGVGDYSQAKSAFQAMQRVKSRSQESLFGLARVAVMQGDYTEALRLMEDAEDMNSSDYLTYCRLGDLYMEMKDYSNAATSYLSGFALADNPQRPYLALINLAKTNWKSFEDVMEYAVSKSVAASQKQMIYLYGNVALAAGHYDKAIKEFTELLGTDDSNSIYSSLAEAELYGGKYDDALRDINLAISQDYSATNLLLKARIELALGNNASAIVAAKSVKDTQLEPEALLLAADGYIASGKYDDALKMLNEAILLNPTDCVSMLMRGYVYDNGLKNHTSATSDYNRILKTKPTDVEGLVMKGIAQVRGGHTLDVESTLALAESKASSADDWFMVAVGYAQSGYKEKAENALQKALTLGYQNKYKLEKDNRVNLNISPIR